MTANRSISYAQAISEATDQAMRLDPSVIVIGQGTRDPGAIFGTVTGLFEKYGEERVIEMPLSENAITGVCIGAALGGLRPILILQRADFLYLAMDQIVNHASKWHFMFGGKAKVPVTIRCIVGKGWGQGPQHSQSLHAIFSHLPGLRVVVPSDPYHAKGLLLNSVFSDDPVLFFEGRPLHGRTASVPEELYVIPFGQAHRVVEGTDVTIAAVSFLVLEAEHAAHSLREQGISAEVIDIVSASPIDYETICASVEKTGRLLVLDTAWEPSGLSAEISAEVNSRLFGKLRAPLSRLTVPFWPAPTAATVEALYYPGAQHVVHHCQKLIAYG